MTSVVRAPRRRPSPTRFAGMERHRRDIDRSSSILMVLAIVYPLVYRSLESALPFIPWPGTAVLITCATFGILALGLNIVMGFAGLLDLGYVAFYAIGAYTTAFLASRHFGVHISWWIVDLDRGRCGGRGRHPARCADAQAPRRLPGHRHARLRRDRADRLPQSGRLHSDPAGLPGRRDHRRPERQPDRRQRRDQPDRSTDHPDPGPVGERDRLLQSECDRVVVPGPRAACPDVLHLHAARAIRSSVGHGWPSARTRRRRRPWASTRSRPSCSRSRSGRASPASPAPSPAPTRRRSSPRPSTSTCRSWWSSSSSWAGSARSGAWSSARSPCSTSTRRCSRAWATRIFNDPIQAIGDATGIDLLSDFNLATYNYLIFGIVLVIMMIKRPEGLFPDEGAKAEMHGIGVAAEVTAGSADLLAAAEETELALVDAAAIEEATAIARQPARCPA